MQRRRKPSNRKPSGKPSRAGDAPRGGSRSRKPSAGAGRENEPRAAKSGGKPKPKAAPKAKTPHRPAQAKGRQSGGPTVRWEGLRPMFDFWGEKMPRYYNLETLANSVEWALRRKDLFITPSIQQLLGPVPVTQYVFELFQEGQYQLIFRLKASNAKKKEAAFGFVVAKREALFSKVARTEHENLRKLYERMPDHVVRPFYGGLLFMPRHRGKEKSGRQLYAYVTQWLNSYHEMGVNKDLRYFINIERPQIFTDEITEALKGRVVEVVARSFDPASGECMEMPQIASGDFVVEKPKKGVPRIKLIACRKMLKRMTPARVMHRMLQAQWQWGKKTFYLSPQLAGTVFTGLEAALGKDHARAWIDDYCREVDKGTFQGPALWPVDEIRRFGHAARR